MATGNAVLDFGAFPGSSDASVAVTGQAAIASGSFVEAWLVPTATADHSADEHLVEAIKVVAGNIVAGTGFTIYGLNMTPCVELDGLGGGPAGQGGPQVSATPRIYGLWSVAWVWA